MSPCCPARCTARSADLVLCRRSSAGMRVSIRGDCWRSRSMQKRACLRRRRRGALSRSTHRISGSTRRQSRSGSSSTRAVCCATVRALWRAAPRPIYAHRRSRSTWLHSRQSSAMAASSRGACRSFRSSPIASSMRYATTSATGRDSRPEAASEPLRDIRFRSGTLSQCPLCVRSVASCLQGEKLLALAFKSHQDSWPLLFVKAWIGKTLHWDRGEHVDVVEEPDPGKPGIQGELLNALHGLTNLSRIAPCLQVVFDECPHHPYGEASLRDTDGVPLGGEGIEVAQAALEHVERMQ